ncbi:hypothetical protein K8T06_07040 [bacterium]|nr:hypothetical protein [bacterium]
MSDPATMQRYIEYCNLNYPSDRRFLSIYGHGWGWRGVCPEDGNDRMSPSKLRDAITDAGNVDILAFTAPCNMGCLEVAYAVKDCVDVMIGSELTSYFCIWKDSLDDICELLINNPETSNIEIGEAIIGYLDLYSAEYHEDLTMCAVRTDKLDDVAVSIDALSAMFIDRVSPEMVDLLLTANLNTFHQLIHWDVVDLMTNFIEVELDPQYIPMYQQVLTDFDAAIIAEVHDESWPDVNGLSIFFPRWKQQYYGDYDQQDFCVDTRWEDFIKVYREAARATPTPTSCNETGVTLMMPSDYFRAGDDCSLTADICNAELNDLENIPFFCLMEFSGMYWFYPLWSEEINYTILESLPVGLTVVAIIELFTWPENVGSVSCMQFIAAVTDQEFSSILGSMGYWEFGWGP